MIEESNQNTRLVLADSWDESTFTHGTFGGNDQTGIAATLESGTMTIRVVPAYYEAQNGLERVSSLVDEVEFSWRDPITYAVDVERRRTFVVYTEYEPVGGDQRAVYTVTTDPGDALAAAVWLANGSEDDGALERNLRLHRGVPVSSNDVTISDDDALTALFADEPDRCIYTGNPTRSHVISVPYRYAPLLVEFRYTDRGVPRVPSTMQSLMGAVSHNEWTDRKLEGVNWETGIDRVDAGEYQLNSTVASVLADASATAFTLDRLGDT